MRDYREQKPEKFKRTPEQQEAVNERRRERYASDLEFRENAKAASRKRDPLAKRDGRLRTQFGIGSEEYDTLLAKQGGGCAICGERNADSRGHRLHVDHCHDTGAVRGILCSSCNIGLGKFKDSVSRLDRAIEYLLESRQ
ncbi:endonuclease VII domain-containing protein [Rhizobium phaseoli]|uniref:endonuclease VII domain-containing protein n=1 Tax=Rhizobium phaseoli TaxID=396 RepID=UPI0016212F2A